MSAIIELTNQPLLMADNKKRTVRGSRRRPSKSSGQRERAKAPKRKFRPSSGGSGGSRPPRQRPFFFSGGGGGGQPPSWLIIGVVILLVVCGLPLILLFGDNEGTPSNRDDYAPVVEEPVEQENSFIEPDLANNNEPFLPPPASTAGQTWLVMLYADADDKILEQDIYLDVNEMERVGSNDRVHIVTQIDRFDAGFSGDGNWSSARRFYITHDRDLNKVNSQQIIDLGEVNMADGNTLVDFATWAIDTFPADKHVLIMSDHGLGWPGGWSDPNPGSSGSQLPSNVPLANALGDELYLMEIDQALTEIRSQTGIEAFELIGMDACLMSHIEVFAALAPHARYAVASQEVEPALGWAYTGFLSALAQNPDMTGADLGQHIVDSYIHDDQRLVDDDARVEFLNRGSPLSAFFGAPSAQQIANQLGADVTLTAVDLAAIPTLIESLNNMSYALQTANQAAVAQARNHARSYTNVFGRDIPPPYLDLGNFVEILQAETRHSDITETGNAVLQAIDQAVIAERHGSKRQGSTGISIYFPNSQLYRHPATGPQSYTVVANRFAAASLWDDYLAYHYTGRAFDPGAAELVVPDRTAEVAAPGAAPISLSPITLSDETATPGQPILMSTDISLVPNHSYKTDVSRNKIGYIYFWTGFYDQTSNSIFVADTDFIQSGDTRQVNGVYYPEWGAGDFTLEFEWEPLMFGLSDGENTILGALSPQNYGAAMADATYSVDGLYTYADGGETRTARLYFRDGELTQVLGFTGENSTGAPREIIPQIGDKFTLLETWLDLDANGQVETTSTQEGGVLTFSGEPFTWVELEAAPGNYVIGFIVEDLDGNSYEVFTNVTVE
ncbi:MAG: hypothetical protein CSB13_11180 [Chloroflexi bacterium]|nr:MAG: hypothetical protein CSB13_11180 [Chloroflexota bacterium]